MPAAQHFNIQRQDHLRTRGYQIIVMRSQRYVTKFFGDGAHGGPEGALRAAIAYRDSLLRSIPPPMYVKRRSVRSKTGIPGVHLERYINRRGRVVEKYVACWVWPPRSRRLVRLRFSVKEHGRRLARRLAIEARAEALKRTAEVERLNLLSRLGPGGRGDFAKAMMGRPAFGRRRAGRADRGETA